jgi:hypothetical protein
MSHKTDLQQMAVAELARRCADETELYFHHKTHDTQYCFELFRRAIRQGDQLSWEMICLQYQPLVTGWIKQHPRFESSSEEIQYFVNGTFAKIAGTLTPEKFAGFSEVASLLRYLKMCVHSVIFDHTRKMDQMNMSVLDDASEEVSTDPLPEEQTSDHLSRQALWGFVDARLNQNDPKERYVIHGSFVLDLKPQEIFDHFRNVFTDVDEIYRVKQNVLARLRRDPEMQRFLGEHH